VAILAAIATTTAAVAVQLCSYSTAAIGYSQATTTGSQP
jgi:hypothetical protein